MIGEGGLLDNMLPPTEKSLAKYRKEHDLYDNMTEHDKIMMRYPPSNDEEESELETTQIDTTCKIE